MYLRKLVILCLFFMSSFAQKKVLTFTADENMAVFVISQELYKEVNKELAKEDLYIKLVKRPLLRGIQEVNVGELDGDVGRAKTKVLLKEFSNLRPLDESLVKIKYSTMSKKRELDFTKKLRYGVQRGTVGAKDVMKNFELVYLRTAKQKYEMLENNRIDFFMIKQFNNRYFYDMKFAKEHNFIIGKKPYIELDVFPLLNKQRIIYQDKLKRAIKRAKKSGAIDQAIERSYQILIKPKVH